MFIELVDALRCPAGHEDTWLVAAVEQFHGRYVARGSLGCPICRAQYRVEHGAVCFGAAPEESGPGAASAPDDAEVVRARALLDLGDGGGVFALVGSAARFADALQETTEATLLLVNPVGVQPSPGLSTLWIDRRVPLAAGTLHGALVEGDVPEDVVRGLALVLRAGGRLVAPASSPLPDGLTELARDDREWVASLSATSSSPGHVPLRRRGR